MAIALNTYVIYKHTAPNGKSYIGLTKNYASRSRQHKLGFTGCTAFIAAVKKYGWNSFKHEVLIEKINLVSANFFEQLFIKSENTLTPYGYNLKEGGRNAPCSEETKIKISESQKGKKRPNPVWNLGKKFSEESKNKMSESAKARGYSDFAIERMRQANIGNKYLVGRKASDETKKKMSESHKGRKMPEGALNKAWETRRINKALQLLGA